MKTKTEIITPAFATEVLEKHNPRNRTISEGVVQIYATDMKHGRWTLTHQGIAFDENDDLIDGQHRLWAVIFSGKEIEMMVTRGIPLKEVKNGVELFPMDSIDSGRIRTTGQKLQLSHGVKNGNVVAAAVRGIVSMASPTASGKRITTSTSLAIYNIYGKDIEAIVDTLNSQKRVAHITAPLALFHHGEPEKALAFRDQISTLENLSSQARAFVRYLEQSHDKATFMRTLRVHCNCLHAFHQGNELKQACDGQHGVEFILGMFPSLTRRVRDESKSVEMRIKKLGN